MRHEEAGFNLVEMLVVLVVLMAAAAVGAPPLFEWAAGLRVEMAAQEMAGILHKARIYSIRHNTKVAVKFRTGPDGVVTHALYRDGDGDGVRNADIAAGVDPEVGPPRRLAHLGRKIRFGFPPAAWTACTTRSASTARTWRRSTSGERRPPAAST